MKLRIYRPGLSLALLFAAMFLAPSLRLQAQDDLNVGSLTVDHDATINGGVYVDSNGSIVIGGYYLDYSGLEVDAEDEYLAGYILNVTTLTNGSDASFPTLTVEDELDVDALTAENLTSANVALGAWDWATLPGLVYNAGTYYTASPEATFTWKESYGSATQMTLSINSTLELGIFSVDPGNLELKTNLSYSTQTYDLWTSANSSATSLSLGGGNIYFDASARTLRFNNSVIDGSSATGNLTLHPYGESDNLTINPAALSIQLDSGWTLSGNSTAARINLGTNDTTVAIGGNASVLLTNGTALAAGRTSGWMETAIGASSAVGGSWSVGIGGSSANGSVSFALGHASAGGDSTVTIGLDAHSGNYGTAVLGHYNDDDVVSGWEWNVDAPAFYIGVGNSDVTASALVVYNNGETDITGNTTLANPAYVSPSSSTQPLELQVNGTAEFNGNVTLNGNATVQPLGNISMGDFGD